jgi:peptidoglycan hydrolase-like protein with peptidoglycan-binding domain
MQALLNYQNYPVGTPDGLFGTGTETVLKAYQAARQLDSDGICGENTWQSLTLDEPFAEEVLIDQNGDPTTICSMGDSNNLVQQLQQRLASQYQLFVSGIYDLATGACVRAYQTANGITANGNVGPITWKKLFPVLKLGRGSKDEVRPLQMLLTRQKHSVLLDGIFGSGTQAAVKAYQTLRGLTSDGIVGESTWNSLCLATPPEGIGQYFGTGGGSTGNGNSTIYREGDIGADIHQIKRRMAVENLFTGTVNSIFDLELTYAVKQYQSAEGTRIDGLVGPATWSLLFPIVKKQTGQQRGAKAVQALLNLNGYSVGTPDGLFGTGSETKLKAFQSAKGLTPDGVCGAQTWEKLCEI